MKGWHSCSTGWKSPTIKPGDDFEQELDTPGAYGYFCTFHGAPGKGMYGTLIVKNADGSLPERRFPRRCNQETPETAMPKDGQMD